MAPKRKTMTETSSSFDKRRFLSKEAEDHYALLTDKSSSCSERPVQYKGRDALSSALMTHVPWFADVLKKRKWEEICTLPGPGCMKLVREFYANAREPLSDSRAEPSYKSFFRKSVIDYSPEKIREILGLPTPEEIKDTFGQDKPDYHSLLYDYPQDDIFEAVVGRDDAKWGPGTQKDGTVVKHYVKRTDLKPQLRVWAFLASDNFLPTLGKSELRKEMLTFIYCIHLDLGIDLARVISRRIHDVACTKEESCLGYPLLITALVHSQMKTPIPAIQEKIEHQKMLTFKDVTRMIKEQKETLEAPRVEGRAKPPRKPTPIEGSSSSAPHEEEPPAWAVSLQNSVTSFHQDMMMMGGGILHRMGGLDANMQTLRTASGQDMPAWREYEPYTELERRMVDLHLGSFPGAQEDDDDPMT